MQQLKWRSNRQIFDVRLEFQPKTIWNLVKWKKKLNKDLKIKIYIYIYKYKYVCVYIICFPKDISTWKH